MRSKWPLLIKKAKEFLKRGSFDALKPASPSMCPEPLIWLMGVRNFTILLVEDDPLLVTVLRELLEFGGHSVVTCGNGREAVQQLSVTQIDLVITDLSMPEMDGLELIKVLTFEWPDTRIIAMSGLLDGRARQLTEMYGVDALLQKPFSLEEMLNVVQVSVGTEACKRADRVKGPWFRN